MNAMRAISVKSYLKEPVMNYDYPCLPFRYAVHIAISQKAVNVMKILLSHKANIDSVTGM